jgi:hypothetical protein
MSMVPDAAPLMRERRPPAARPCPRPGVHDSGERDNKLPERTDKQRGLRRGEESHGSEGADMSSIPEPGHSGKGQARRPLDGARYEQRTAARQMVHGRRREGVGERLRAVQPAEAAERAGREADRGPGHGRWLPGEEMVTGRRARNGCVLLGGRGGGGEVEGRVVVVSLWGGA